jgi:uncharacterized protein
LITGGYRYAPRLASILTHLTAPLGVICTFGNHDYSIYGKSNPEEAGRRADFLARSLRDRGIRVLRNECYRLGGTNGTPPLQIVGLDDEWSGNMDADAAFDGVDTNHPILVLNHNPANCLPLMKYPWHWMLSGHTHGRQLATSAFGRTFYPARYRHFTHGYYSINGRHLYVNRGLAYGQRVQHWCKPEITLFRLRAETEPGLSD